jgi:uncharacterized protein YdaL
LPSSARGVPSFLLCEPPHFRVAVFFFSIASQPFDSLLGKLVELFGASYLAADSSLHDVSIWRKELWMKFKNFRGIFFNTHFCASSAQNVAANREKVDFLLC